MNKPFRLIKNIYERSRQELGAITKSPSISSLGIFAGGNIFVAIVGGLAGLMQARWLEPDVFGEFRKYAILTTYLAFGYSLVHDGLIRQYPYFLGKGNQKAANQVAGVAKWWYSLLTVLYIILFAILALIALFKKDYRATIGWTAQITGSISLVYGTYLGVMYRTSTNFKRLSYNNIISTVLGTIELVFVKLWGYWGLAIRVIMMHCTSVWLNKHYLPVKIKAYFDSKIFYSLAKISLRFSIPGYIHSSALVASLNALILYFCGQSGLGIYALAVMVQGMALTFSDALNQIFQVKISTKYGETEDVYECLKYTKIPAILGFLISMAIAFCLFLFIDPFIKILLPKYWESIPVIQVLSIAILVKGMSIPLIVINSALWYKTYATMCILNFCVVLITVLILPKTPILVAIASILGMITELIVGYFSLIWNYYQCKLKA